MRQGAVPSPSKEKEIDLLAARTLKDESSTDGDETKSGSDRNGEKLKGEENAAKKEEGQKEEPKPPPKKVPVFFLDEAHKVSHATPSHSTQLLTSAPFQLPALIQAEDAMKTLLDSMLVLTKQDRLCHVIHATSDPFYMCAKLSLLCSTSTDRFPSPFPTLPRSPLAPSLLAPSFNPISTFSSHRHWLRQMNVMQHANVISIGDCSKKEAQQYFEEVLVPHVPDKLKSKIKFEELYSVFGGKLAHLADYSESGVRASSSSDRASR